MALIYIGSDFEDLRLKQKGSFVFTEPPHCILFNKQSKTYFVADTLESITNGYDVTWTSNVTKQMSPGDYTLEIYSDDSMAHMLYRKEAYARAVTVAASLEQEDQSNS